ncbi:MAG: helix-turn-helix domain-containing protein [Candidatus Hodarchaeota archaeon]
MNLDQIKRLLGKGESQDLERKKDWPQGILRGKKDPIWDKGRGELLKDLISLANSEGSSPVHLVLGVKDLGLRRRVYGITKLFDDADFQQWATNTFDPSPKFSYNQIEWKNNANIGVFTIERIPDFPHVVKKNLGDVLYKGQVWFRRGTQNNIAGYEELRTMFEGEKPIKIVKTNDPEIKKVKLHYKALGRDVTLPLLEERDKHLIQGYEIAVYPGTRREIWAGLAGSNRYEHILLLTPQDQK